jgi:uncharacterized protein YdeI (BOF family)
MRLCLPTLCRQRPTNYRELTMTRISHIACIALLITGSAAAVAQTAVTQTVTPTTAPATKAAPAGYAGPSGAPLMTAKDLLANGKDDQYVRLKGKSRSMLIDSRPA